jgi:hypothetical protein
MVHPSLMAHAIGGVLMFFSFVYMLTSFYKIKTLDIYRFLVLLILFSIGIMLHGVSHLLLEKEYTYNPLNM